jgi:hypothetical protein
MAVNKERKSVPPRYQDNIQSAFDKRRTSKDVFGGMSSAYTQDKSLTTNTQFSKTGTISAEEELTHGLP